MKPISTVPRALANDRPRQEKRQQRTTRRSDVCAVPAAGIVAEAMVMLTLADAIVEKFGDSVTEVQRNLRSSGEYPGHHSTPAREHEAFGRAGGAPAAGKKSWGETFGRILMSQSSTRDTVVSGRWGPIPEIFETQGDRLSFVRRSVSP